MLDGPPPREDPRVVQTFELKPASDEVCGPGAFNHALDPVGVCLVVRVTEEDQITISL